MTTTTNANGRTRKSLADQIDRLDGILDGLSDALQGAVADAVKEAVSVAVKEAVEAVLTELITNPALREQLHQTAPPAPSPPQDSGGIKGWFGRAWGRVSEGVRQVYRAVENVSRRTSKRVWAGLLTAAGVTAATIYLARSWITTVAGRVWAWIKRVAAKMADVVSRLLLPVCITCWT